MSIKAVLFDLDDTLLWDERSVDESFKETCLEATKVYDVDPIMLEEAVKQEARKLYESYPTHPFILNIGINPFEGLWANFNDEYDDQFRALKRIVPSYRTDAWTNGLRQLGIEDSELGYRLGELFPAIRRTKPIVYEETFSVLDRLKGKYKLLLLTNGSPELQQEKLDGVPELASYFDHIVVSGAFGQGKPKAAIFEHCMALLQIEANEGIMIGDKLTTDIKGALGVGMPAVWINRKEQSLTGDIVPDYEITNLNELFAIIAALG